MNNDDYKPTRFEQWAPWLTLYVIILISLLMS